MDTIPSKEKVSELPAEQQEVIGRLALDQARSRKAIQAKAQSYRGAMMVPLWIYASFMWLLVWRPDLSILFPILGLGLLLYIDFHARGINSRINALIKLLDFDSSPD